MLKIYHNPRCSKSRQALQIIRNRGIEPDIILYMDNKLTAVDLTDIIVKLGFDNARQLLRTGEKLYKDLGLKNFDDESLIIEAMVAHPKLIERPIIVYDDKAVLGRPPENVLKLLK